MAEIGHLSASVRLSSLLFGPVLLKDFTLEDVSLLLESNENGISNWKVAKTHAGAKQGDEQDRSSNAGGLPVMLENVRIGDVVLVRRQSGAPDQRFRVDELTITADSSDQLHVAGTG